MKQLVFRRVGPPDEVIEVVDAPSPRARPGEVVVAIEAASINPDDLTMLRGIPLPGELPAAAGCEGAGRVIEVGEGVPRELSGQRVVLSEVPTWAEEVAAPADRVLPVPSDFDPLQAAMLSVAPMTAYGLVMLADLPPRSFVLQNAAAGAVGKLVVRFAKYKNLRTINVVRREPSAERLEELGADLVLIGEQDLVARVQYATQGAPIRLALDAVGGSSSEALATCLADGGVLITYGLLSGEAVRVPGERLVVGGVSLKGFARHRHMAGLSRDTVRRRLGELLGMARAGLLPMDVAATYPLEEARRALRHAETPARGGRVLFVPKR
jgi:trans-2-enoyl-CoA reductase